MRFYFVTEGSKKKGGAAKVVVLGRLLATCLADDAVAVIADERDDVIKREDGLLLRADLHAQQVIKFILADVDGNE